MVIGIPQKVVVAADGVVFTTLVIVTLEAIKPFEWCNTCFGCLYIGTDTDRCRVTCARNIALEPDCYSA